MEDIASQLSLQLSNVVGRTTWDWIGNKRIIAKETRKLEEQQIIYDEIINRLADDKAELEMIARKYKEAYERVTISDEDIEHLQKTIRFVIDIIKNFTPMDDTEKIQPLVELVNKDTLKTMQLLGFNYKEAIGQPLTEVCASAIANLGTTKVSQGSKKKSK